MIAALFLNRYVIAAVAIVAAVGAAWWWADSRGYRRGAEAVTSAIKTQDAKAATAADKARLSVDQCFDAGREWDVATGRCAD